MHDYDESIYVKNHICPCGYDLLNNDTYANIYKIENWEFNEYTKKMELVYAVCQHNKVLVDKRRK